MSKNLSFKLKKKKINLNLSFDCPIKNWNLTPKQFHATVFFSLSRLFLLFLHVTATSFYSLYYALFKTYFNGKFHISPKLNNYCTSSKSLNIELLNPKQDDPNKFLFAKLTYSNIHLKIEEEILLHTTSNSNGLKINFKPFI